LTAVRRLDTDLGALHVVAEHAHVTSIVLPNGTAVAPRESMDAATNAAADLAIEQLRHYLAGALDTFDLPLDPAGTTFQREVWFALAEIPYGRTQSYGWLAARVGRPTATRAVGATNGRNPIPIVLPCHRVIGSNGSLTGYGGGLPLKRALLDLERRRDGDMLFT
jgi:methylated-DNA-[protein]-cysteine S-methyltransferase